MNEAKMYTALERQLDDFDPSARRAALDALLKAADAGEIELPPQGRAFNLHCHSFFSYNGYGYSPTALAWKGRAAGLCAMGLVDFDVLDGVDEFLEACGRLGLRACAGFETRIFVPEFADRVMNSPGEPGIAYHMGMGFPTARNADNVFLSRLKAIAQRRNHDMVNRINAHLDRIALDYDRDVIPLTPRGNPTERHVCMAYDAKARALIPEEERAAYWAERLGVGEDKVRECIDDAPTFQGLIRAKTMKAGGVGYVTPDGGDFPRLDEINLFTLACGAIPTFAWLDGTTPGEEAIEELLDVMVASGVAAVNIIPDRNWNLADPDVQQRKVQKLHAFVAIAQARHLPILVGTEMNAYGQRFVDDFDAQPMQPLYDAFLDGACIMHAHTVLAAAANMGYLSDWAQAHFAGAEAKNRFYREVGARMAGPAPEALSGLAADADPDAVLAALPGA